MHFGENFASIYLLLKKIFWDEFYFYTNSQKNCILNLVKRLSLRIYQRRATMSVKADFTCLICSKIFKSPISLPCD